ncbi:DNA polymerase III subunit delta [Spiroplasma helicoides]|uniref:DNA polymerase III subunit delta n=1 Tax=Spiroplasma helicoides TaxID=216938 RepID=A0A1B3SKP5_9MOLU|nr:hypothetical protein [Spiroplasma helicoides]AOG60504.1 DNA polymerase III subunit delta [Spiroplasma helicoides]
MILIYSLDNYLIKKQLDKLIDKINVNNDHEVFHYSLIEDSINNIYEQINTYSLFANKKIVIINDCYFLNESKISLHKDFDSKIIENIMNFNNNNVEIIFTLNSDKLSKKLNISKKMVEKAKTLYLEIPSYDQKKSIMINKLTKNAISYEEEAIEEFFNCISDDMQVFSTELNKIINLQKHVNVELVKNITNRDFHYDIYKIVNSFINLDLKAFLKGWSAYIETNGNIYSFLALLSNQFSVLRNSLLLKKKNFKNNEIADFLKQNPYRIQKLLIENRLNINQINDRIKLLYKLENNIKRGKIDSKILPELELIKCFLEG